MCHSRCRVCSGYGVLICVEELLSVTREKAVAEGAFPLASDGARALECFRNPSNRCEECGHRWGRERLVRWWSDTCRDQSGRLN